MTEKDLEKRLEIDQGVITREDSSDRPQSTDASTIDSRHSRPSRGRSLSINTQHDEEDIEHATPGRSLSRPRPIKIVPRAERRGLFASLTLVPEVEEPIDYARSTKWFLTLVVGLAAVAAPMGSSIVLRMSTDQPLH
jgi:hypothetical protein